MKAPLSMLRGHCTFTLKLAYFVRYLKVMNPFFFRKVIHASLNKLSKELKNVIEISVRQIMDQNSQNNYSGTHWPALILMSFLKRCILYFP